MMRYCRFKVEKQSREIKTEKEENIGHGRRDAAPWWTGQVTTGWKGVRTEEVVKPK